MNSDTEMTLDQWKLSRRTSKQKSKRSAKAKERSPITKTQMIELGYMIKAINENPIPSFVDLMNLKYYVESLCT